MSLAHFEAMAPPGDMVYRTPEPLSFELVQQTAIFFEEKLCPSYPTPPCLQMLTRPDLRYLRPESPTQYPRLGNLRLQKSNYPLATASGNCGDLPRAPQDNHTCQGGRERVRPCCFAALAPDHYPGYAQRCQVQSRFFLCAVEHIAVRTPSYDGG